MTVPRSETQTYHDESTAAHADAVPWSGAEPIRILWEPAEEPRAFSVCFRGDLRTDPLPASVDVSDVEPAGSDARRLSGRADGDATAMVVDGELLAATFEEPAPTLWIGDEAVEADAWPTVEEYAPTIADSELAGSADAADAAAPDAHLSEPVPEPFPERGMLGKPLGDPLDPKEFVVEIEADDAQASSAADDPSGAASFVLEIEGDVTAASDAAEVAAVGADEEATGEGDPDERVAGELTSGASATVELRGSVSWIETDGGVDVSVRERDR